MGPARAPGCDPGLAPGRRRVQPVRRLARRARGGDALPIARSSSLVIAPQAYAGYATEVAREAADEIFVEPPPPPVLPSGAPEPDPSNLDTAPPSAVRPAERRRHRRRPPVGRGSTALIIGVDAGIGRNTYLTDTMIVVSLDPATKTVSMVSIPRDMVDVPLADGRKFRGKINGLVSYARHHPKQFPGSDGTGFDVLHGRARQAVGLKINVLRGGQPRRVRAGRQHARRGGRQRRPRVLRPDLPTGTGSPTASRSRRAAPPQRQPGPRVCPRPARPSGESDFTRAARQQEVLSGIRDRIVKGGFLNDPIGLLKAVGKTVTTNVPRKILPDLADAATKVGRNGPTGRSSRIRWSASGYDARGSIQIPNLKAIRALAADDVPDRRHAARRRSTASPKAHAARSSGSGVARLPARRHAQADAEADEEADAEADGQAHRDGDRDPDRGGDPDPRADAQALGAHGAGPSRPGRSGELAGRPASVAGTPLPRHAATRSDRRPRFARAAPRRRASLTGLAATVSAAPALPACRVADTLTKHRSLGHWQRSLLDPTYRLSSAYIPDGPAIDSTAGLNGGQYVRSFVIARPQGDGQRGARRPVRRFVVQSAYRSYATQKATFDYWVRVHGYAVALKESARAGHSEHQLGTTSTSRATAAPPRGTTGLGRRRRSASGSRRTPGNTAS